MQREQNGSKRKRLFKKVHNSEWQAKGVQHRFDLFGKFEGALSFLSPNQNTEYILRSQRRAESVRYRGEASELVKEVRFACIDCENT